MSSRLTDARASPAEDHPRRHPRPGRNFSMFRSSCPAATSPRVPHEPLLERGPHHGRYLVVFHGLKAEVVANTQLRGRTARSVLTRELRLPGAVAATSVDVQKYKRLRAVEVALCDTPPQHADRCGPKLRRREPRSSRARRGPLRARGLWRSCSSFDLPSSPAQQTVIERFFKKTQPEVGTDEHLVLGDDAQLPFHAASSRRDRARRRCTRRGPVLPRRAIASAARFSAQRNAVTRAGLSASGVLTIAFMLSGFCADSVTWPRPRTLRVEREVVANAATYPASVCPARRAGSRRSARRVFAGVAPKLWQAARTPAAPPPSRAC